MSRTVPATVTPHTPAARPASTPRRVTRPRRSGLAAIIQKSALALRRMRTKACFIGLGAPAGPVRHHEIAVHDVRHVGEQFVIPCQAVDIGSMMRKFGTAALKWAFIMVQRWP